MVIKCEIKLNDPNGNGVYYVGQIVSGEIEVKLTQSHKVKDIDIHFKGKGFCKWTEQRSTVHRNNSTVLNSMLFIGRETYLNSKRYLLQQTTKGVDIDLAPGSHKYSFACQLPNQIPPSIDVALGYIRYRIVVTIARSWRMNQKFRFQFKVLIPLHLNNFDPIVRESNSIEKLIKFFNCKEPLVVRVSIPKTGYAIDEVLSIAVDANNLSSINVTCLEFVLRQHIDYRSTLPWTNSHFATYKILKQKSGTLPKLKQTQFDENITVPYLPVTDKTSSIISVSYDLEIVMVPKGCRKKQKMVLPIIIGNVPIDSQDNFKNVALSNEKM